MINLDTLRAQIRGGGFKPFTIHLSSGQAVPVPHPEFIAITPHVVLVGTEEGLSYSIDPLHIVAITEERPKIESSE